MKPANFPARKEARRLAARERELHGLDTAASRMLYLVPASIRSIRTKKARTSTQWR